MLRRERSRESCRRWSRPNIQTEGPDTVLSRSTAGQSALGTAWKEKEARETINHETKKKKKDKEE